MRIRRGFLSDTAHDDVINYLVACGQIRRFETQIVSGEHGDAMKTVPMPSLNTTSFEPNDV